MPRFLGSLLSILLPIFVAGAVTAQEPVRFARTPDISPDGARIAFSYLGDIWIVDAAGGTARLVTSHPAHDINPAFSPDGKFLAFSSNRHGSYDVFVVPIEGGSPRRLTFDSAADMVTGWTPDGKNVLFVSNRGASYPDIPELYTVPFNGGQARRIAAGEAKAGAFTPDGKQLAYVRGPGSWYRQGYHGSSNDDIWICDADGSRNRQVTHFDGQDHSPNWSPDGRRLYYVTEQYGVANLVSLSLDPAADAFDPDPKPKPLTHHTDEAVRRARISGNGEWIVYECGFDLWLTSTHEGSVPRKLRIEAHADDKVNPERMVTFTGNATEFAVAPDEKHAVVVLHGNLFLIPIGGSARPVRLTETTCFDHGPAWAPDGTKLLFVSDRTGQEDVYLLESNDPDHAKIVEASSFKVRRITDSREPETGVSFGPDGKRVAFVRAGQLWTMNPDGADAHPVVPERSVFDYEWSPDGKWFVYARRDANFGSELYVVPAEAATAEHPPHNITRYATFNGDVTWSGDGKRICFLSQRGGTGRATPFVVSLHKPAVPGADKTATAAFDWEDIHLRAQQVVSTPTDAVAIAPEGNKIAFRASNDLWVANADGGQTTRITNGGQNPRQIQWSKHKLPSGGYADVVYFLDGGGSLRMVRGGSDAAVPFKVRFALSTQAEYTEMFEQGWRFLAENYYDAGFHGRDWKAIRDKYRPILHHVVLKEDLYALIYLMLGELNSSHLGISGYATTPDEITADLGLLYDDAHAGPGLKVVEVLRRGPADRRGLDLKAGDIIQAIDGVQLDGTVDVSKLLNGKVNESVTLSVTGPMGERPHKVDVQGVDRGQINGLMYERWIERNAARVAAQSGGKMGYIHIPSMDDEGMDRFVRALYSDNFGKEGLVLDLRYNGGGFTHDKVLSFLGAKEHHLFKEREGGEGLVVRANDRKWTKPLVVLINNRSFSDAEVLPSAIRSLGLGKIVGEPTGGAVIFTGSFRLIDGSNFRIPSTGVFTTKGVNREREGVQPDVLVLLQPEDLRKGVDPQLEKAVEVLRGDVDRWKKNNPGGVVRPDDLKPMHEPMPMPKSIE